MHQEFTEFYFFDETTSIPARIDRISAKAFSVDPTETPLKYLVAVKSKIRSSTFSSGWISKIFELKIPIILKKYFFVQKKILRPIFGKVKCENIKRAQETFLSNPKYHLSILHSYQFLQKTLRFLQFHGVWQHLRIVLTLIKCLEMS